MLAENGHLNEFFVNKKILLNECSCAAKLNYNTDKKSYSSTCIVIFKMHFTIFLKAFFKICINFICVNMSKRKYNTEYINMVSFLYNTEENVFLSL